MWKREFIPLNLQVFFVNHLRWCRLRHAYYDDHTLILMSFSGAFSHFTPRRMRLFWVRFTKFERNKSVRSPGIPGWFGSASIWRLFHKNGGSWNCFFSKKSLQLTSDDETSTVSFTFLLTLLSGNEKVYVSMVDPTKLNSSGDFLGREKCWPYRLCKSGQVVGMWDLLGNHDLKVIYPVSHDASMGGTVYLPTFLVDFYGKCREIYIIHGCYGYDILVNHSCFKLTFWPPEAWWHPKNWRIKGTVTNPEEVVSCTHLYPPWN